VKVSPLLSQSSRRASLSRFALVAISIGFLVSGVISGRAAETNAALNRVETKLRSVLASLQPAPAFEHPQHFPESLRVTYLPQRFLVHHHSHSGEIATNTVEEIGPSHKGFVLRIQSQPYGLVNQAAVPQTIREPYWETYLDVTPIDGMTNQIYWSLAYGSRADHTLLEKVKTELHSLNKAGRPRIPLPK